jgi:hypothetical protein
VEQCIAFALNSELSLSVENDTSENVLLQNVSTFYISDTYFYMVSSALMIFSFFYDFFGAMLNCVENQTIDN